MTDELRIALSKWNRGKRAITIQDDKGQTKVYMNDFEISSSKDLCCVIDGIFSALGVDVDVMCMLNCRDVKEKQRELEEIWDERQ